MVKYRAVLSFILVVVWTAAPALACVPKSTMTQVEMECCKKMAGDCHMGSHNHPCCDKKVSQDSAVATFQQSHVLQPVFAAVLLDASEILQSVQFEFRPLEFASPPHSPPPLNSPLRI
jgi:hypothetical protein